MVLESPCLAITVQEVGQFVAGHGGEVLAQGGDGDARTTHVQQMDNGLLLFRPGVGHGSMTARTMFRCSSKKSSPGDGAGSTQASASLTSACACASSHSAETFFLAHPV